MMPATSATGVMPACSQPRSLGLTRSIAVSTRCSSASRRLGSRRGSARLRHRPSVTYASVGWDQSSTVAPAPSAPRPHGRDAPVPLQRRAGVAWGAPAATSRCGSGAGGRTRHMWLSDVLYAAYARRLTRQLDPTSVPRHVGVMLDGNRRWAKARGAGASEGHQAGADNIANLLVVVRRGRRRGGHPVAAVDRQPQPPREGAAAAAAASSRRPSTRSPRRTAGASTRSGRSTCCPAHTAGPAQGGRGPTRDVDGMLVNVAVGYGGRREIADAVRSLLQEHADPGHQHRGARRGDRRRAHRRAPLHQGPARPRPRHPHLGGAAARRASCSGRARTASSTSARPTGPTSARSTSCGRCAPSASATAASAS